MRKLRYVFTEKPPLDRERRRINFEVQCLEEANRILMEYIKDGRNKFKVLEQSPLASQRRHHALPNEFLVILQDIK